MNIPFKIKKSTKEIQAFTQKLKVYTLQTEVNIYYLLLYNILNIRKIKFIKKINKQQII
jgi:hypothetical protein